MSASQEFGDSTSSEAAEPQKKKHPLGKLVEEFKPKSYWMELAAATAFMFLLAVAAAAAAPFVPQGGGWLFLGAGVLLVAAAGTGYICYRGPSKDHIQIRKRGVEFRISGEVIRLGWNEIQYVDSAAQHTHDLRRNSNTSEYQAYIGAGPRSLDLDASFLGQFDDSLGILKAIRKNSGGTTKYVEMPREDSERTKRK
jgi:hypothetical protein